jgi:hypothetical protein
VRRLKAFLLYKIQPVSKAYAETVCPAQRAGRKALPEIVKISAEFRRELF